MNESERPCEELLSTTILDEGFTLALIQNLSKVAMQLESMRATSSPTDLGARPDKAGCSAHCRRNGWMAASGDIFAVLVWTKGNAFGQLLCRLFQWVFGEIALTRGLLVISIVSMKNRRCT